MIIFVLLLLAGLIDPVFAQDSNSSLQPTTVRLFQGSKNINFNDLFFSPEIHQVLVPAGKTRKFYLASSSNYQMMLFALFAPVPKDKTGPMKGVTSADEGGGMLFIPDHDSQKLNMIDVRSGYVLSAAPLAGDPGIVRYTGINFEVWVTEPQNKQIEAFVFTGYKPNISSIMVIPLSGRPESLVIDHTHHRVYTNVGQETQAIDADTHTVVGHWPNGCGQPRGEAIDEKKGFLFVGCSEGKVMVFDLKNNNTQLGSLMTLSSVGDISYNASRSHLYVTGPKDGTLSVLGVSGEGQLSLLESAQAAHGANCVTGDDHDNIWVCDPSHGQLLRYKDVL